VVPDIVWSELNFSNAYAVLKPYLWSYVAGTLILGVVAAVIAYFVFHHIVVRYRKMNSI
jgi:hypothetical protein